jgi:hypothetical protein
MAVVAPRREQQGKYYYAKFLKDIFLFHRSKIVLIFRYEF